MTPGRRRWTRLTTGRGRRLTPSRPHPAGRGRPREGGAPRHRDRLLLPRLVDSHRDGDRADRAAAAGTAVGLATDTEVGQAAETATQQADTAGIVGGIDLLVFVLLVIVFVAYSCGGYVAGRMARFDGMEQGLGVWLWAILVAVLVAVLVASLVGALLGELAGMRFHRKVDRTGLGHRPAHLSHLDAPGRGARTVSGGSASAGAPLLRRIVDRRAPGGSCCDDGGPGRGRDAMRLTLRGDLLDVVFGRAVLVVGA